MWTDWYDDPCFPVTALKGNELSRLVRNVDFTSLTTVILSVGSLGSFMVRVEIRLGSGSGAFSDIQWKCSKFCVRKP